MPGKACYQVWRTNFEIDQKYGPIKAIGKGAYGVVCSAKNAETGEKVRGACKLRRAVLCCAGHVVSSVAGHCPVRVAAHLPGKQSSCCLALS